MQIETMEDHGSSAEQRVEPRVFGPAQRTMVGLYHPPRGGTRATAIVLCNPFGYESLCVHRAYRHLAEKLAAAGFPVLRFDHHGTGDSSGDDVEPDRVRAWLDGIHSAIDETKLRADVTRVSLIGVRLGATLATVAGSERDDVDALVTWAPLLTGKSYTRELRAFRLLKQQEGEVKDAPDPSIGEEAVGFLLTKSTVQELGKIDLLALEKPPARRALLLSRDDLAVDPRFAARLRSLALEVDEDRAAGHAALMLDPHESVVPEAAFDAIVEWLARGAPERRVRKPRTTTPAQVALDLPERDGLSAVREEIVRFGPADSLFGVVTTPRARHDTRSRTGVVFLNVGANHRVGPNRMYVVMARHLAALGFVAMRFDIAGLGDSPAPAGKDERRLYAMDSIDDVRAAMHLLREHHGVDRVVLVGLCSGAYLAYHTAARISPIEGVVLINPQTYQWREGDSLKLAVRGSIKAQEFYRRALLQPETWRRALRGDVHIGPILRGFGRRLQKKLVTIGQRAIAKAVGRKVDAKDVAGTVQGLVTAGTDVLMLFSEEDGGIDEMELHLGPGARRMQGQPRFSLRFIERADHTFTTASAQRRLRELVAGHLLRKFG